MTAMTAFLRKTGHGSGKEEKRPQWRLYNERSRRGWYSDTPLKTDARGDALEFPPTTFDNISLQWHQRCNVKNRIVVAAVLVVLLAASAYAQTTRYFIYVANSGNVSAYAI